MHRQQAVLPYRTFQVSRCEISWERAEYAMHFQKEKKYYNPCIFFKSDRGKKTRTHKQQQKKPATGER